MKFLLKFDHAGKGSFRTCSSSLVLPEIRKKIRKKWNVEVTLNKTEVHLHT